MMSSPNLTTLQYGGSIPAKRWMTRLLHELRLHGITPENDEGRADVIYYMNICAEGQFSTFLDNHASACEVVDRCSSLGQRVTETEYHKLVTAACLQFPQIFMESSVADGPLRQGAREPLSAYLARAMDKCREFRGVDVSAVDSSGHNKSVMEVVHGLADLEVRRECFTQGVMKDRSVSEACKTIRYTAQMIEERCRAVQRDEQDNEYEALKRFVELELGQPVKDVVSRFIARESSPQNLAYQAPRNPRPYSPPRPVIERSSHQPDQPVRPQEPRYTSQPRQQYTQPTSQGFRQDTQTHAPPAASGRGHGRETNRYSDTAGPGPSSQFLSSRNPFVSGLRKITDMSPGVRLCVRCGQEGHISPACMNQSLEPWETEKLRNLVFSSQTGMPHHQQPRQPPVQQSIAVHSAEWEGQRAPRFSGEFEHVDSPWRHIQDYQQPEKKDRVSETFSVSLVPPQYNSGTMRSTDITKEKRDECETLPDEKMSLGKVELVFDACVAGSGDPSRKRRRDGAGHVIEIDSADEGDGGSGRKATRGRKGKSGTVARKKGPAIIRGREGKGPFDWKELAEKTPVTMSLLDLYQISPEGAKSLQQISQRRTRKSNKTSETLIPDDTTPATTKLPKITAVNLLQLVPSLTVAKDSARAAATRERGPQPFRLTVDLRFNVNGVAAKPGGTASLTLFAPAVQVDQGAELSLVSRDLVSENDMVLYPLSAVGMGNWEFRTADGTRHSVSHFVSLQVEVGDIKRCIWAVVQSSSDMPGTETKLLLGLPWLFDVNCHINIRDWSIEIGDTELGEKRTVLNSGKLRMAVGHGILLVDNPANQDPGPGWTDDSTNDDSSGLSADDEYDDDVSEDSEN